MAHIHGGTAAESARKVTETAGAKMHSAAGMMAEGGAMKHMMGPGMGAMMSGSMAPMMEHSAMRAAMGKHAVTAGVATGAAVTATGGHSLLRRLFTHPLVLFGTGIALGVMIHKYREEILNNDDNSVTVD